ncbi:MAG: DUF86 domain-containing protein [Candidatus Aminicenantes bacterium]|nr:DUF86 domain-containing protein [Candidatus Aminicenantes bacterium]NIM84139.1 DUF86 domain-containing protein [Candidatus Aminicenantes bacterium]NIN23587.1 DUF86 domain-containing protein [Candidatus Aminicenantes bacterium]NIN47294.1 DUF86 domain-containing protein [Candidatus Aminicenantes bacterium]NIN90223.1 DUF86 domain-containing protein [Candidatus Aminicenantes bacterium]
MQPEDKDSAYLWDMLDAAQTAAQFTPGITIEEYLKDRKIQLAIERLLEIIGEAANRVSTDFQKNHPEIPWRKIVGQRNVITHEYGEIKQERIWTVVSTNIPELIEKLEPLVKSIQQEKEIHTSEGSDIESTKQEDDKDDE